MAGDGGSPVEFRADGPRAIADKITRAGLQTLRAKLEGNIKSQNDSIRAAIEKDKIPPKNTFDKVMKFLISSGESDARNLYGEQIKEETQVIKAIDEGDKSVPTEYLAKVIESEINGARRALLMTGDRGETHSWIDHAQEYINILVKIDPKRAREMQDKLEKKTRNPLDRF
jgi:hypothetical protein